MQNQVQTLLREFAHNNRFNAITYTPTSQDTPVIVLENGRFVFGMPLIGINEVCDAQLRTLINRYGDMLGEAERELAAKPMLRAIAERDSLRDLLQVYTMNEADGDDLDWLNVLDDDDDDETDFPDFLGSLFGSSVSVMVVARPGDRADAEAYDDFCKELGVNPSSWSKEEQIAFLKDFIRYNTLAVKVAYAEQKAALLSHMVEALKREKQARQNERDLRDLRRNQPRELAEARHNGVVEALVLVGVKIEGDLEAKLREEYGDDAESIITAVNDKLAANAALGEIFDDEPLDEFPDWLTEGVQPEGEQVLVANGD